MAGKRTCSSCGAELPSDAPGGMCVPCTLRQVIEEPTESATSPAERPTEDSGSPTGQETSKPTVSQREMIALSFPASEKAGDLIGRYKLLEQLGEGGCGIV